MNELLRKIDDLQKVIAPMSRFRTN